MEKRTQIENQIKNAVFKRTNGAAVMRVTIGI